MIRKDVIFQLEVKAQQLLGIPENFRNLVKAQLDSGTVNTSLFRHQRQSFTLAEGFWFDNKFNLIAPYHDQGIPKMAATTVQKMKDKTSSEFIPTHTFKPTDSCVLIGIPHIAANFGHFLTDALAPALWIREHAKNDFLNIDKPIFLFPVSRNIRFKSRINDLMHFLNFDTSEFMFLPHGSIVMAKAISPFNFVRHPWFKMPHAMKCLRDTIHSSVGKEATETPQRQRQALIIYRNSAEHLNNKRDIDSNSYKLIQDLLVKQGFNLEFALPVSENFDVLFQKTHAADVVVGVMGANMSLIIGCRPQTKIIFITPCNMAGIYYASLCESLGLSYNELRLPGFGIANGITHALPDLIEDLRSLCR